MCQSRKIVFIFSKGERISIKFLAHEKRQLTKKKSVLIHLTKRNVIKNPLLNRPITKVRLLLLAIIVAK